MLTEVPISCPFCGEAITLLMDCSVDEQSYTEDCAVCCRPILVHMSAADGELVSFNVEREN